MFLSPRPLVGSMSSTKITLNNGVLFPMIGLGTYKLQEKDGLKTIVAHALKLGYRLIDTATGYRNEDGIGSVLKDKLSTSDLAREDIFITSKLAPGDHGVTRCRPAVMASLNTMQLAYLDMYLIHWPGVQGKQPNDSNNSQLRKESWQELEQLYREGKLRSIGVSNYTVKHLEELLSYCTVVPAVLQVEIHPYLVQQSLLKFCADNGIHVQAYSSFGGSSGCRDLMSEPAVKEIAACHGKSCAQVLLRWAVQHGISVIPKTSKLPRLEENFNIFGFELTKEDMQRLDGLDKNHHYCWDPTSIS